MKTFLNPVNLKLMLIMVQTMFLANCANMETREPLPDPGSVGETNEPYALFTIEEDIPNGTFVLNYPNATITEIEIYAVGGGGGGQGGDNNSGLVLTEIGTGGAGGGGGSSYVKLGDLGLSVGESVSLNIIKGIGGAPGNFYSSAAFGTTQSGSPGANGNETRVRWEDKNIEFIAKGGFGGGGNEKIVSGGLGGTTADLPRANIYFKDGVSVAGKAGTSGDLNKDMRSEGGSGAKIEGKGTLSSFGGSLGAIRAAGGNKTPANAGGGGSGGYSSENGTKGGDGWVTIVVHYYTAQ